MFVWCTILFLLGITAFLDTIFNYGEIFRRVNSVLFMLVSLGLLVRTTTKMKTRRVESYIEKIEKLENEIRGQAHENSKVPAPKG
jgi:phage-related holin